MKTLEERVEEKLKELSNFQNIKWDRNNSAFSLFEGNVKIHSIVDNSYPIITEKGGSFKYDGKSNVNDKFPTLFKFNPFIEIAKMFENENNSFNERWMMVCDNSIDWKKRKVIMSKNNKFIAWDKAETDEDVEKISKTCTWNYAKEIEESNDIELTLEEIAEKFGVDVKNLKIKK